MADEKDEMLEESIDEMETGDASVAKDAKGSKAAKAGKTEKKKKSGGNRFGKFFRDTRGEFKKIIWPTFPTVVRNTCVTLAMCAVLGLAICLFDFGLSYLINLLLSIKTA